MSRSLTSTSPAAKLRLAITACAAACALAAAAFWLCNRAVESAAAGLVYARAEDTPTRPVALVLGTSKRVADGRGNLFFRFRIEAAAGLYKAGRVRHIIVSGDNSVQTYDEATDMRDALVELGVPDSAITRDYAGFRTFDSVVRCKEVFGQSAVTIVSQQFHAERALYIARSRGMDAVAFRARGVAVSSAPLTYLREGFARVAAVIDVHWPGRSPKFLGPPVRIEAAGDNRRILVGVPHKLTADR